jgi:uncharacterized integral membrane protein
MRGMQLRRNPSRVTDDAATAPPEEGVRPERPGATPASVAWTAVIIAVMLLALVAIFILQNTTTTKINFLAWHARVPVAAALLISLVVGAAITVAAGGARIHELHRRRRHGRREPR